MLIDKLVRDGTIESKEVENVMRSIDRGEFVQNKPYVDK